MEMTSQQHMRVGMVTIVAREALSVGLDFVPGISTSKGMGGGLAAYRLLVRRVVLLMPP
ncbi:hypothetical protein [Deinococcus sonorensis]|uniref:Uncharacterized protein n=1 Tax=Deinococcus sonorensis TaxID=309891 RepID=A0ABV8YAZ7_9DEIO